ncbi:MAG: YgeY family selenium metabolism-linked hydrolase [Anaerolineae bacterium]
MLNTNLRDEVVAFTQELVRLPSLPGQEREVARAVEAKMRALGYDEVWIDGFGSVAGIRRGTEPGPTILFDSHSDTVEITSPQDWTYAPFGGELSQGKIWGRGSTDMKGALAGTVVALGRLPRTEFRGTLAVSGSVGEEVLEGAALSHVMARIHPDFVVICEPSECKLGIGQKGRTGVWVSTTGRAAHTSNPHLGDNAVYKMIPVIERLRAMPLPQDEILGQGVMELAEIQSFPFPGKSIVPDGCRARFDRRLMRGETMESVLDSFRRALVGLDGWSVEYTTARVDCYTGQALEQPDFFPAWALDQTSEWYRLAVRGLESAGLAPEHFVAPYCANGSYSAGVAGIPTLIFGPSTIKLAHAVDEYIEVEELLRGAAGFVGLARELSAHPSLTSGAPGGEPQKGL